MDFIITFILIVVTQIVALILYATWYYGLFENMGIPVVKPFLFLGSNYNQHKIDTWTSDVERLKKYGEIYGVYDGRSPMLFISNPKLIRLITTVDFDNFVNHGWDIGSDSLYGNILDLLKDEKWKVLRASLTKIFSSAKIREISSTVNGIASEYASVLSQECAQSGGRINGIKFKEFLSPMVIEIICNAFCGIQISNAGASGNSFVKNMKIAMMHEEGDAGSSWTSNVLSKGFRTFQKKITFQKRSYMKFSAQWFTLIVINCHNVFEIPEVFPFLHYFTPGFKAEGMDFLLPVMKNALTTQDQNTKETGNSAIHTLIEMWRKVKSDPEYKRLGITEMTVLAQVWDFLLAGYIGFRDTFDNFMYEMAMNEDVQEKLYEEISAATREKPLTLENITMLPFLNACIQETTRLHVLVDRIERVCNKDWHYNASDSNGLNFKIPKGLQVIFPIAALHLNPMYYPQAEKFIPERFLSQQKGTRDPYSYLGFGHGPRGCIAQRFSVEILKVLIAIFITKFQIHRRNDTKCETNRGGILFVTYKSILLDISSRNN